MSVNPKPRPSLCKCERVCCVLFRRRERSLSLRLKTLLRLQLKEVFSTDLISRRGVNTMRRGAGLVYALAYLIEIRSCYPRRDIIQISGDI